MLFQHGDYSKRKESRWYEGIDFVLQCYQKRRFLKVLDVGCGDGSFYRFLKKRARNKDINLSNLEYHGIDIFKDYEVFAQNECIKFTVGDALFLEKYYKAREFDIVIASEIIEHVDETDKLIRAIKYVTKDNGYLYLTTPNLASYHARLMLLLEYHPLCDEVSNERADFGKGFMVEIYGGNNFTPIHHIRCFTLRALKDFLIYHGFKILKIYGGGYRKIDKIWRRFPGLSPVIKIIAQKNRSEQ